MTNESQAPAKGQEAIALIKSPLSGVDPRSLDALMSADVETLSDPDVDAIVAELRRVRAQWALDEAAGKVPRAKAASKKGTITQIDLKDLGF